MPVLNQSVTPAQKAASQILSIAMQQFQQLARSGNFGYNLIWNNPNASPMEVLAALGTNAKAVFELANLNIQTIEAAAVIGGVTPPVIPSVPSDYSLIFNADGSVTLTGTQS